MTPAYAHVSWETMVRAVEVLEQQEFSTQIIFGWDSGKIPANGSNKKKAGEG